MKIDVKLVDSLDAQIKQGHADEVRLTLAKISQSEIPRNIISSVAKLALRVGEAQLAFSVLKPIVNADPPISPLPSNDEMIQYGMCLKQLGASEHALKIFKDLPSKDAPEVLLYEAITLFTQWRYSEAIPKLFQYLDVPILSEYQKMIGSLNLASAFIFENRYDDASELLRPLVQAAEAKNNNLVHGNSLELLAQISIYQKQFDLADERIKQASTLINQSSSNYRLFLEKWSAVNSIYKTSGSVSSLQSLDWVRNKAIELKVWETVRDCDFFFAITKNNRHLFNRQYFGTPFKPYRQRLLRFDPTPQSLPEFFDWRGNTAHQPVIGALGLLDLSQQDSDMNLSLVKALAMDFYAPIKAFTLYLKLFPDEKLDPAAAVPRIYSSVSRANKWFKVENMPLKIEASEAGYRLNWLGPYTLRIPSLIHFHKDSDAKFVKLQNYFAQQTFSSTEAAEILNLPKRSVVRLLNYAASDETLEISGQGRNTRYRFRVAK